MRYTTPIKSITPVTHNVHHYKITRPKGYTFTPGQATEVSIAREGWAEEKRPFTFTCLPDDHFLEFTIKHYPEREGVTDKLRDLNTEDAIIIGEPWGTIEYKGPGVFIAGGAGITPFIAILRNLHHEKQTDENVLIFANQTEEDIILKDELEAMPGLTVHHVLSDAKSAHFDQGFVDKDYLTDRISDFSGNFYVCGPKPMQESVLQDLKSLGANPDALTFEK